MFCFQISPSFWVQSKPEASLRVVGGEGSVHVQRHSCTTLALWHPVEKCKFHHEPVCKNTTMLTNVDQKLLAWMLAENVQG